jgi:hypothetical protein
MYAIMQPIRIRVRSNFLRLEELCL